MILGDERIRIAKTARPFVHPPLSARSPGHATLEYVYAVGAVPEVGARLELVHEGEPVGEAIVVQVAAVDGGVRVRFMAPAWLVGALGAAVVARSLCLG